MTGTHGGRHPLPILQHSLTLQHCPELSQFDVFVRKKCEKTICQMHGGNTSPHPSASLRHLTAHNRGEATIKNDLLCAL